jgi:phosphohistidine phosphatase
MKLYVMRHGVAEDEAESGADADRALTATGRERTIAVAKKLADVGEAPLHIVTSPLVRAVQTAEIVAVVTELGKRGGSVETRRAIAPGGDAVRLAHLLAHEGRKRVMFVGHEPDLSALVASLVGAFGRPFEKSMVVAVQVPPDKGRSKVRFVLEPKTLELDPDPPAGA